MEKSKREEVQKEVLDLSVKTHRMTAGVSVGVGKTLMGLQNMNYLYEIEKKSKFLVVAPKLAIFQEWKDEAFKRGYSHLLDMVDFTTYRSLKKQKQDYDAIYLDEVHSLKDNHDFWLSFYRGRILGLTGTPPKYDNTEKGRMIEKYCPVTYSYLTDTAVEDGILNDYSIIVHQIRLGKDKTHPVKTKKFSFMTSEQASYDYACKRIDEANTPKQLQFGRIGRMTMMKSYRSKESYAKGILDMIDGKCLIFCNTTEQADRMCKFSYHSKNHKDTNEMNIQAFKGGNIDLMSCVMQLSEGVNIPQLKIVIILHAYGNEKKLKQRIGRALRLKPDEKATIHVLMYKNTIDEKWVNDALSDFDQSKITYTNMYGK